MIHLPPSWPSSQYASTFVQLDKSDQVHLCRVAPSVAGPCRWWEMEAAVRVPLARAAILWQRDPMGFRPAETHDVGLREVVSVEAPATSSTSIFFTEQGTSDKSSRMSLRCPTQQPSLAKRVTLAGSRLDARSTVAHLSAALTGKLLVTGATVYVRASSDDDGTCLRSYTVVSVELDGRGSGSNYSGVVLMGAATRLQLNHQLPAASNAVGTAVPLTGLDEQRSQLRSVLELAASCPGWKGGVIVRGPPGCGVGSLAREALAGRLTESWSPTFDAQLVRQRVLLHVASASLIVLVIHEAETIFSAEEEGIAGLTLRRLQHDVNVLTTPRGQQETPLSVVVIATTHNYSNTCTAAMERFFTFHVVVEKPDLTARAAIFAKVVNAADGREPLTPEDAMAAAHPLVGASAAEVVAAAHASLHFPLVVNSKYKPVRWADIGGLEEVKAKLRQVLVMPQKQPEVFKRFGLQQPKGILLYGPPGCAKTSLIRALCSEVFFSMIYLDSATVVSAYVGESERQLREVFAKAAQQTPCVVFFDEVEVIGAKRSAGDGGNGAENVRLLSTLLTELDGFAANTGVCFVGATNVPHLVDDALLRPGRLDYLVHVPLPNLSDRQAILDLCLDKTGVDTAALSAMTEGFSGADLRALCAAAFLDTCRESSSGDFDMMTDTQLKLDPDRLTRALHTNIASSSRPPYDHTNLDEFIRDHQ